MSQFPTVKISDLVQSKEAILQTGPFGTQLKASDYVESGIPVINVRNIGFGNIRPEKLEFLSEKMVEKLSIHKLRYGDIVFGRKGAVERHTYINNDADGWIQGSDCLRLRICSERINNKFVSYYFMTTAHQNWMKALCSFGSTMASLNQNIVKLISLPLPPIEIQNKIAAILSAYDDLIENNKRRIALLENLAEEIYREWFVRFRFPGYQEAKFEKGIPVEWKKGTLGQITNLIMGQSPKSEYYNDIGDGFPFHQGVGTYGNRYPINKTFCSTSGRKAKKGSILFSVRAPVGRLNIANTDMIIGRGLSALTHKSGYNSYLYYLLKTVFSNEDIIGNGSIFNSVCKNDLQKFGLLIPKTALIKDFNEKISKIDRQIDIFESSNEILEKTKKSLLGRLISGKLSVEDLDIQFPPSML